MYKLLTFSLLSLTLTLLPFDLEKSGERACCFNRNKYGKLKAKLYNDTPYTRITLSGWQNPATITGHCSIVLSKISWYREALPTVEMPLPDKLSATVKGSTIDAEIKPHHYHKKEP